MAQVPLRSGSCVCSTFMVSAVFFVWYNVRTPYSYVCGRKTKGEFEHVFVNFVYMCLRLCERLSACKYLLPPRVSAILVDF